MTPARRGAWQCPFSCRQQYDTLQQRLRPREDAEHGGHVEGRGDEGSSSSRCWTSGLKAMTPALRGAWQWRFPLQHQLCNTQLLLRPRAGIEHEGNSDEGGDEGCSSDRCWNTGLKAVTPTARGAWRQPRPCHHQLHAQVRRQQREHDVHRRGS
eukprot:13287314-Alexandrium_andersonii.AAC.1